MPDQMTPTKWCRRIEELQAIMRELDRKTEAIKREMCVMENELHWAERFRDQERTEKGQDHAD